MTCLAKSSLLAAALVLAACQSSGPSLLPACSAALTAPVYPAEGPAEAAACSEVAGGVGLLEARDLAVPGFVTVGPAIEFTGAGPFAHGVDFVLPYVSESVPAAAEARLVVLARKRNWPAHAALVSNVVVERAYGRVHFHAPDVAVFQLALPAAAAITRHLTYRAIGGVSMGGLGASVNFWSHPERYDAIGVMGADPGPDLTYSLGMIRDFLLGGFCTDDDRDGAGASRVGQACAARRALLADQGEHGASFDAFWYERGAGTGLTLSRGTYLRANRDLARAFGNAAYYNPLSINTGTGSMNNPEAHYLPPGIPAGTLTQANADICAHPIQLTGFYDARYNRDGNRPVITFCDGNDSDANGLGRVDPTVPATDPAQILLAVDVNKNGRRDAGEPVIVQSSEPFRDVGSDGLADADEPGYDPRTNPDPNGDDYHYLWNPSGTENNWRYDEGEPFTDSGLDGVMGKGCEIDSGVAGCFDHGEGNGRFDRAPGLDGWLTRDPRSLVEALPADALERLDVYYDAGIRDFFNAQVSTNSLVAALAARGLPVRAWDGFPALLDGPRSGEGSYDYRAVDLARLGRRGYVRYGDPDLNQMQVEASGDGRHVGSVTQAVHRAETLLRFLTTRWPDGDRAIAPIDSEHARVDGVLHGSMGRDTPYVVVLPPGYFVDANRDRRYPVVYLMHGYGMDASSLAAIAGLAESAMVDASVPEAERLPKAILVLVDARCQPGGDVGSGPLVADGDRCEEGAFYTDHADGNYRGQADLVALEELIDRTYRTRPPGDVAPAP